MNRGIIASLMIGASIFAAPHMAFAQAQPQAAAGQPDAGLQEIVVTANRTESSAQKTAVALTVYTGADLAAKGVANVQSLASIDPSVNVTSSTGAAYVAIRGIASTDVTEIGDPSVPIARDGFYTNRSFSIQSSMYDVARIEVLKGPQGTLNGRNSTGGLVSIITNRPSDSFGAYGSVEAGNYGMVNVEGGINVPLNDKVAIRISGTHRQHDGYRYLTGVNIRGDDENVDSGRIQIALHPIEGLHIWGSYQHDDIKDVGDVAMVSTIGTRPDFGDAKSFPNQQPTWTSLHGDRGRWEVVYDALPAGLTLTYAGGYDKEVWKHALDASGPAYPALRQFLQSESPRTWNHEVRLSNSPNSRLFFQVGYFHFQEANVINSGLFNTAMTVPFFPDQSGLYGIKFDYRVKTKSDAVFGQVAYKLTDTLKLTVGARYTWDKKERQGQAVGNLAALAFPLLTGGFVTPGDGSLNDSQPTYHVGIDYSPTPTNLFYAKFDTGYKSGGFNSNGASASQPYGAEKLDAFEIGTKNRFFGNKVQFNAAAFYFDYRGYQASKSTSVLESGSGIFNVGNATIYGAEAQFVGLFGHGGRIDLNGSWLHTEFGKGIIVRDTKTDGSGDGVDRDISGNRLPNAPTLSFSAGLEYGLELGNGAKLTPRLEGKYSSAFYYTVFNDPDTQSRPYMTGNASIAYAPDNGRWQVQAFIRNFTDKVVLANAARNYVSFLNTYQFQPPRTYGVRLSFKY